MRAVLQRVTEASVKVDDAIVGAISHGWLVLIGIHTTDTPAEVAWMAEKIAYLRAFEDDAGKMNRSVLDVNGSVLVVSQFTLYGDCQKGRRPSFIEAARPETAIPLYESLLNSLKAFGIPVAAGVFGADMKVSLTNDGPVTLILDSPAKPPGFIDAPRPAA
jgi:D-tyrosyl-tRNA(Tyr) deacylase